MGQIVAGTYKARASGESVLGTSKNKGTAFLEFNLQITEGEFKGRYVRWTGYFTENTQERAIQSLIYCGWAGEDLNEFSDGGLHGLDTNEVDIVVEIETYENEAGEEKEAARVAWINRPGGYLNKEAAMSSDAAKSFSERMRGLVNAVRGKTPGAKGTGADFDPHTPGGAGAPVSGNAPKPKAF